MTPRGQRLIARLTAILDRSEARQDARGAVGVEHSAGLMLSVLERLESRSAKAGRRRRELQRQETAAQRRRAGAADGTNG